MTTLILSILSFVAGFGVGFFVYRNNSSKLKSTEDKAKEAVKIFGGK